jgi:hypothetical protein
MAENCVKIKNGCESNCQAIAMATRLIIFRQALKSGPDDHAGGGFTWRLKFETFGPTFGCHNGFREAL